MWACHVYCPFTVALIVPTWHVKESNSVSMAVGKPEVLSLF